MIDNQITIEEKPQDATMYKKQGDSSYKEGRYEDAYKNYSSAITLNQQDEYSFFRRGILIFAQGNALNKMGRYQDAYNDYSKIIQLKPKLPKAYLARGVTLINLARNEEAIFEFQQALTINPKLTAAYVQKGIALILIGKFNDALIAAKAAIEINPKETGAYLMKGIALDKLGNQKDAIEEFQHALDIDPQQSIAYFQRGLAYYKLQMYENALIDYSKAIELQKEQAIELYSEYAQQYIKRGKLLCKIGLLYNKQGKNKDSFADFQKALKYQPENPFIYASIGRLFLQTNQKEMAKEQFMKALKLTQTLTYQDQQKYSLNETDIKLIQEQAKQIDQIQKSISQIYICITSQIITKGQQNLLQENIQKIEDQFNQQINQSIDSDKQIENNGILQQVLNQLNALQQQFNKLNQEVQELKNQKSQLIQNEMDKLMQNKDKYIYYQSLYWKLINYITACQAHSTGLFENNDIDADVNHYGCTQISYRVAQQISNTANSIPIVGIVIQLISQALQIAVSSYYTHKSEQIFKKLTQIVELRCKCKNDIDEQIQLAIIRSSQNIPDLLEDQYIDKEGLIQYVVQIQDNEDKSGNLQAKHPYWKQGILDTLIILQNMLINYEQIQQDKNKELHVVILDALKTNIVKVKVVEMRVDQSCCQRIYDKCQIF